MIPKIIHYCWFGPLDKEKYLSKYAYGWKKILKDYQIIEWNESNFLIDNAPQFVKEAYSCGKYAFVSDYVRLYALYNYGGIYLDTDIEVKKSFDDILNLKYFMGYENNEYLATCVIGAEKKSKVVEYFMSYYDGKVFLNEDGSFNTHTNTKIITQMLAQKDILCHGKTGKYLLNGEELYIFSREYFSPYDYIDGKNYESCKTYTIHHFEQSWLPQSLVYRRKIKILLMKIFGEKFVEGIKRIVKLK